MATTTTGHRFVVRLVNDRSSSGWGVTRGYQVRIRSHPHVASKFFSDSKCGSRRDALIAALKFRNRFCRKAGISYD
jgi:hypothetical protein